VESSETVVLTLASDAAYDIGSPNNATITIADNDQPPPQKPTVTVVATDANAAEAGRDTGTFTVSRTGSTAAALTVKYALTGTAVNGTDYDSLSGSVTIPAGASSATVTVRPIDDTAVEGSETVVLTIASDAAYDIGSPNNATVTIADNDQPPPPPTADFTANPTSGSFPLTVQFTDKSTGTITAWDWNFGDGLLLSSTRNPSHTYLLPGDYTATLTVTGSGGATSRKSMTIHVTLL
jgi:PKD repeat protein